jgi:hypothetical protein
MHRDKGNTAADSEIRTAVFSIRKGVGTNGTLVHEMSHSSDRTGRSTGERLPITDVKRIAMFSNSAYSAVNKIVPNEREEEDGYLMSQTLQKQERD